MKLDPSTLAMLWFALRGEGGPGKGWKRIKRSATAAEAGHARTLQEKWRNGVTLDVFDGTLYFGELGPDKHRIVSLWESAP